MPIQQWRDYAIEAASTSFLDLPFQPLVRALDPEDVIRLLQVLQMTELQPCNCCIADRTQPADAAACSCGIAALALSLMLPHTAPDCPLQTCKAVNSGVDTEVVWDIIAARLYPAATLRCPPYPNSKVGLAWMAERMTLQP